MTEAGYTASVEDYLKAIYDLSRSGESAAPADVASRLDVARPSVTAMVRRLAEQGLVSHERYRGLQLTDDGRRVALRLIRRHRVIEAYLVSALGYRWDEVHEEAERLEHSASDDLVDRMASAIGEPKVDPHGAPIPTRVGTVADSAARRLSELGVGDDARVAEVADDDPEMLRYLASLSLVPGTVIKCVGRAPFDGPISVRVGAETHLVGRALAEQVRIIPADD